MTLPIPAHLQKGVIAQNGPRLEAATGRVPATTRIEDLQRPQFGRDPVRALYLKPPVSNRTSSNTSLARTLVRVGHEPGKDPRTPPRRCLNIQRGGEVETPDILSAAKTPTVTGRINTTCTPSSRSKVNTPSSSRILPPRSNPSSKKTQVEKAGIGRTLPSASSLHRSRQPLPKRQAPGLLEASLVREQPFEHAGKRFTSISGTPNTSPRKPVPLYTPSKPPRDHTAASEDDVMQRAQAHLLHLHLLDQAFAPTNAQWRASAQDRLEARCEALRDLYAETRCLEDAAHEMRNVASLLSWSGGSTVYLMRRLKTLISVLEEVDRMITEPLDGEPSPTPVTGINTDHTQEEENFEAYGPLVVTFSLWLMEVQHAWEQRDAHTEDAPATTPAIKTIGDHFKASLRHLNSKVQQLAIRLDEIRNPGCTRSPERPQTSRPPLKDEVDKRSNIAVLTTLAFRLVEGMQEELQMMREIEFEVMEGERAWLAART